MLTPARNGSLQGPQIAYSRRGDRDGWKKYMIYRSVLLISGHMTCSPYRWFILPASLIHALAA